MDEHYVNISSLVLPVSDDEGNQATDEARNQIDTYARELTDALNAGGTLSELAGGDGEKRPARPWAAPTTRRAPCPA